MLADFLDHHTAMSQKMLLKSKWNIFTFKYQRLSDLEFYKRKLHTISFNSKATYKIIKKETTLCFSPSFYHRLNLPVNALAQNMFSCDVWVPGVKLSSFPTKMWSFTSRHCSKGRWFLSKRKEEIMRKVSHFQRFAESSERTCAGSFFLRGWAKIRVQFQKSLRNTLHIWAGKLQSLTPET